MDLSGLNNNQLKAINTTQGPVLVIAGAGTGKTTVLTKRIAYLINDCGVDPNRILAFTFTNKAAEEMKVRINKLAPGRNAWWIKTYHSTCLYILKEDIDKLGWSKDFSIIDEEDQVSLVKTIIKDLKLPTKVLAKKFVKIIGEVKLNDFIFSDHSIFEQRQIFELPDDSDARFVKVIFDEYNKRLKISNQLDFSDLINFVHKLFKDHEETRLKWRDRFDYILIDEFQDTNLKQFEIIKFLVNPQHNVFAVGDPNQTIFTWRGAYPEIFDDYFSVFKGTQVIKLDQNYRSTENILKAANNLISNNPTNFANILIPMNPVESDVNVYIGSYRDDEAEFVCQTIKDFVEKYNKKYSEILILYRANYCSKLIEEKLVAYQIPYTIFGSVNFYQRKEIKDIISYLKMIYKPDDIAAMRIINVPRRSIGIDSVATISSWANKHNMTFVNALNEVEAVEGISDSTKTKVSKFVNEMKALKAKVDEAGISQAIKTILQETKYIEYLESSETEIEDRKDNIDELARSIGEFALKNPNKTIIDFLNEIALYTSAETTKIDSSQTVHLMTVHMAKGKEYDTVFVFNFNEGVIPSPNALLDEHGLQEERRIAYVALTRAINNLVITCTDDNSWSYNKYRSFTPSRFLKEIKTYKQAHRQFKSISNKDLDWYDSRKKNDIEQQEKDLSNVYTNTYQYKVGDVVVHTVFGEGVVVGVDGDFVNIMFKKPYGKKTIIGKHNSLKRVLS